MTFHDRRMLYLGLPIAALLILGSATQEAVSGEGAPAKGSGIFAIHGGIARTTKEFILEIAFHADGVGVYIYDKSGKPLSVDSVKGAVHVEFKDAARKPIHAELIVRDTEKKEGTGEPASEGKGTKPSPVRIVSKGPLWAALDLSKVAENEATARIKLSALPGTEEKELGIQLPFRMARVAAFVCEKDGSSAAAPGLCEKCGQPFQMVLSYYGCKRHADVASDLDGQVCWRCGEAKLEITIEPSVATPKKEEPRKEEGEQPTKEK